MRVIRWPVPEQPPPKRPYRDTVLFHLALAVVIVVVAFLTGGSVSRAVAFAGAFFVLATSWSWWRWHRRLAEERRRAGGATVPDER